MIDLYVKYIIDKLKIYISKKYDKNIDFIYSNCVNIVGDDRINNRIAVSVVNISNEPIDISAKKYIPNGNGYIVQKTPLMFYVYILFRSAFDGKNFLDGLRVLSLIASFFLTNCHFYVKDNDDMLDRGLKDFEILLQKDYKEYANKDVYSYSPALLYKIGLIEINADITENINVPVIEKYKLDLSI